MVKVNIDHQHIKVEAKMELGEFETLVDGQLSWKINVEESMWTLIPGEHIHVCCDAKYWSCSKDVSNLRKRKGILFIIQMNLCKIDERWWDALLENETKIDLQKIESVKSMDDLPDDEHAKLEELIFNEQQKALNKPTTNQMVCAFNLLKVFNDRNWRCIF